MKAIIAAGLCDSGAGGPTARLVRLPGGVNGKNDTTFTCKLHVWEPERRYTPEQLVEGYKLDLQAKASKAKKGASPKAKPSSERNDIFQPAPNDNPVIAALKSRNLYKSDLGGGKHDITCPWCHEHTGTVDGGTGYFEPDANYPYGGFNCFHSHGNELSIRNLLDMLGVSLAAAQMKVSIRVRFDLEIRYSSVYGNKYRFSTKDR